MRLPIPAFVISLLLLAALPAQAQMLKDAALDALFAAERFDELDRAGRQRQAAQADDPQALLAVALASLRGSDGTRRQAVITQAEVCVQRQPRAAACHYALGVVLGIQAASEGLFKLAASTGRVKEALLEAMTLEPGWYAARSAVVQVYALVPSMMGGSTAKALETARAASRPEEIKALEARLALQDGKYEQVLEVLAGLRPGRDSALAADIDGWGRGAAFGLVNDGKAEKARPYFERVARERPETAYAVFGLGRVASETGAPAEAVRFFEQAARLKGADELPIDYRAGIALRTLGRTDAARDAFRRFIATGKGAKPNLDDARKRFDQLGA